MIDIENGNDEPDFSLHSCFAPPWNITPGVPIVFDTFVSPDGEVQEGGDGSVGGATARDEVGIIATRCKLEVYRDVTLPFGLGCRLEAVHTFTFFNAPSRRYRPSQDLSVDVFDPLRPYALISEDYMADPENQGRVLSGISRYEVIPRADPEEVLLGRAEVKKASVGKATTGTVRVTRLFDHHESGEGGSEWSIVCGRTGRMVARRAALVLEDDASRGRVDVMEYVLLDYV